MLGESVSCSAEEGIDQLLKSATARFKESVDVAIRLSTGDSRSAEAIRGVAVLPKGLGRDVKVAVFAKGEYAKQARDAGADVVGDEDLIEEIKKGRKLDFDWCIATPDFMSQVSAIAKTLGPKGLMPNPKFGTVTFDVAKMVGIIKAGQVKFRSDRYGIVHVKVGDVGFSREDLMENLRAVISAVQNLKPATVKGAFLKAVFLNTTMGKSYRIAGLG
ncbi:50S ribosomal protein L1 [Candidatus Anaplasma sp. TIGMIC]|uniref:50S ribosomal protein L1 n=1 Tax=Candidatus Anaplasma sp. TIGMIC TaxID=3020713 RepID=UPI00232EC736|nr:50S ribosomal protein L1 [Candidatus Anaplasma sp. TIGMIC]MDB1135354.1 50S ribosomal protein L1 [Candidatus Anaplasma sp. TIGMIC]